MKANHQSVNFYYGETIYQRLFELQDQAVLIYSELSIYEQFQTKLDSSLKAEWLLAAESLDDWTLLKELSVWLASRNCRYLLIIGNQKVMNIGLFVAANTDLEAVYLFPTEFEMLNHLTMGVGQIFEGYHPVLKGHAQVTWTSFDFTFFEQGSPDILEVFETLVEYYYFQEDKNLNFLYLDFRGRELINHHNLYPFASEVAFFSDYPEDYFRLKRFLLEYFSRVMSVKDIKMTAFLLYLFLSQKYYQTELKLDNLVKWLTYLGYRLEMPDNLSLTRLIDQLSVAFNNQIELWSMTDGQSKLIRIEKLEMLTIFNQYKELVQGVIDE
ncbi:MULTISPECIES: hypothetical protein [unclassified Enterococcus]|uniref:hypothetical protein n=1 Tax=unclassified Enterococcus TaxID=2608891 RepID=UPI0015548778|nr:MULTISPECIES: hypothetical protein [unclassified Enterococcus]MBS7576293.1 hypothetical protein [Enterococcus sp. MMGLQ5-2]MBS7583526.1 hypothetical protein [Enterococcus sp. MMGLQ5-1]NPD11388.1 hypothetical protein [Enterococcus sp. MMGLQ5-1]NPD36131.1 hypothetical protein [Enterococcus sp. MMGLQ5-2]